MGVVMQDDRLLSGTLAENIAFFDTNMDMARVEKCARAAAIHDEIEAMPMGYQSLVGDMGSALSGGQMQRMLLARALYPNPAILMLDEGTANLDAESERKIITALSNSISPKSSSRIGRKPSQVRIEFSSWSRASFSRSQTAIDHQMNLRT